MGGRSGEGAEGGRAYDVAVDEELDQKQIPQVMLCLAGERAQHAGGPAVIDGGAGLGERLGVEGGELLVVLAHQDQAGHEGAEDLGEDVGGHFFPGEVLPDGEADGDGLWKKRSGVSKRRDSVQLWYSLGQRTGLKWPPDVEAQVIMAKAMPKAYAKPIWSIEPKAGSAPFRKKDAVDAIPG